MTSRIASFQSSDGHGLLCATLSAAAQLLESAPGEACGGCGEEAVLLPQSFRRAFRQLVFPVGMDEVSANALGGGRCIVGHMFECFIPKLESEIYSQI